MAVKAGTFQGNSGGASTQAITGLGFTPKFVLMWVQADGGAGWNGAGEQTYFGIGWAKGAAGGSNQASLNWKYLWNNTAFFAPEGGGSGVNFAQMIAIVGRLGELQSLDSDGFTMLWSGAFGSSVYQYSWIAFGGSTVDIDSGSFTSAASTGAQSFTGLSFEPDGIMFFSGGGGNTPAPSMVFQGWCDTELNQACMTMRAAGSWSTPSDVKSYQRTDRALAVMVPSTGALSCEGTVTALTSSGWDMNWTTAAANTIAFIAFRGLGCSLRVVNQPTSTGSATVSLSCLPQVALTMSFGQPANTSAVDALRWVTGVTDGGSIQHTRAVMEDDAIGSFGSRRAVHAERNDCALLGADPSGVNAATIAAKGTIAFVDTDIEITWGTVDATARQFIIFGIGQALLATETTAEDVEAFTSEADQEITLRASVVDEDDVPVTDGTVTFTILDGDSNPVGDPIDVEVDGGGLAEGEYVLPAGTIEGFYTILAEFSGGGYGPSSDEATLDLLVRPRVTITRQEFTRGDTRILGFITLRWRDAAGDPLDVRLGTHHMNRLSETTEFAKVPAGLVAIGPHDLPETGPTGEYRASLCSVRCSELLAGGGSSYLFRAALETVKKYALVNVEIEIWLTTEDGWRAGLLPFPYCRGKVSGYTPEPDGQFSITIRDFWNDRFLPRSGRATAPLLNLPFLADDFSSIGSDLRLTRAQLLLGEKSRDGSDAPAPVPANEAGNHSQGPLDPGVTGHYIAGFGDRGGTVPTGFSASLNVGAGAPGSIVNGFTGVWVFGCSFKPTAGVESEMTPFIDGAGVTISDPADGVDLGCDDMGAGDYFFWIGRDGERWDFIKVTSPGSSPVTVTWDGTNHTGASQIWIHYMRVRWNMPDGLTAQSPEIQSVGSGPTRIIRFAVVPEPGALSMRVEVYGTLGSRIWLWPEYDLSNINGDGNIVFENDQSYSTGEPFTEPLVIQGAMSPIITEMITDDLGGGWLFMYCTYGVMAEFISAYYHNVAAGTITRVLDSEYGSWIIAPGKPNFSTYFADDWIERNDRRHSGFFVRGAQATAILAGEASMTFNAVGVKTLNGAGGTAITKGHRIWQFLMRNFWAPNVPHPSAGATSWNATPEYLDGEPRIDDDSVLDAEDEAEDQMVSLERGYLIRGDESSLSVLKAVLIDIWAGQASTVNGAASLVQLPPPPAGLAAPTSHITHINEILDGSFGISEDADARANTVVVDYDYDDVTQAYLRQVTVRNTTERADYQDSDDLVLTIQLRGVASATVAEQVGRLALGYYSKPERTVQYARNLHAIHDLVGAKKLITHPDGPRDGGYQSDTIRVRRMRPDFAQQRVVFDAHDLGWLPTAADPST